MLGTLRLPTAPTGFFVLQPPGAERESGRMKSLGLPDQNSQPSDPKDRTARSVRQASSSAAAWEFSAVGLITLVAALLRFLSLSQKSFWFDEGVSVAIARLPLYDFLRILWRREANMSLYYLLLRGWLLLGHSEGWVRSLSALFAIATVPMVYWLGRRMFDARIGAIAAALLAVNAYHIRYAQEARSYALFTLLATLSVGFLWNCATSNSASSRRWHIVTSVLTIYAHFYGVLLVVSEWAWARFGSGFALMVHRNWRRILVFASPTLLFVVLTGVGPLAWIPRPGFREMYQFLLALCGNGGRILLLLYVVCITTASVSSRTAAEPTDIGRSATRLLLLWLALPPLLILLVSQARPVFLGRYFVFTLPALVLLAACGITRMSGRWISPLLLVIMLSLSLRGTQSYYAHDFDIEREDWRGATSYVLANAQPGDAVIFYTVMGRMPYEYYRWNQPGPEVLCPRHGDAVSFRDFLGHPDLAILQPSFAQHARVWLILSHNQRGLGQGSDAATALLAWALANAYPKAQPLEFPGVQVRLYASAPANGGR